MTFCTQYVHSSLLKNCLVQYFILNVALFVLNQCHSKTRISLIYRGWETMSYISNIPINVPYLDFKISEIDTVSSRLNMLKIPVNFRHSL